MRWLEGQVWRRPGTVRPILAATYGDVARVCKGLRQVAKTLILTAVSSGSSVDSAVLYARQYYCSVTGNSVKNTFALAAVLFALSLSVWAVPSGGRYTPPPPPPKPKPSAAVPEGGNWPAYTIVSGVALLGGLMLARKRETETVADRS